MLAAGTGHVADAPGTAVKTRPVQAAANGGAHQRRQLLPRTDGGFRPRDPGNGLCADVDHSSASPEAAALRHSRTGTPDRRWTLEPEGTVETRLSGLASARSSATAGSGRSDDRNRRDDSAPATPANVPGVRRGPAHPPKS
ncbi:hypothetical protein FHS29_003543 [Saccharothrix tamanrassetensis]|uniref:Ricin B lectin domain-containing protein n=1 Tax=Saccharothrix tamanrassetensis TaxID=1051531 RepID=A0A841CIT3_9PSEU|nr:hypothetical protein [Saccharothrix tamanrassetensis]